MVMQNISDSYDVIIVGGGSAGCVLASRLSEQTARRVLLIEAGEDHLPGSEPLALADPGVRSVFKPEYFWSELKHELIPANDAGDGLSLPFLQARVLGGGSSINGTHAQRGLPRDYDEWRAFGVEGWDWANVLPYFRALESDLDFQNSAHGANGPIKISRVPEARWSPLSHAVHGALVATGSRPFTDLNSNVADGVGPVPLSADRSRRMSTAVAYLGFSVRDRSNLDILSGTTVSRLLVRDRQIVGVEFDAQGGRKEIQATETIVSCGAIGSPALLLRSGIGPQDELAALGIPVVVNRPGVGKNLINHPMLSMNAHLGRRGRAFDTASSPCSIVARFSSNVEDCPSTDMILNLWERVPSPHIHDPLGRQIADFMFIINKPFSVGSVTLNTADPNGSPTVRFKSLSDPRDLARMKLAARKGLELMSRPEVASRINMSFLLKPTPLLFTYLKDNALGRQISRFGALGLNGPRWLTRKLLSLWTTPINNDFDDSAIEAIVKMNVNAGGHPSGTCRLGNVADDHAVIDSSCRVIGVGGLSVVDASIFPTMMTAGTNLPVIMAAERFAAELFELGARIDSFSIRQNSNRSVKPE